MAFLEQRHFTDNDVYALAIRVAMSGGGGARDSGLCAYSVPRRSRFGCILAQVMALLQTSGLATGLETSWTEIGAHVGLSCSHPCAMCHITPSSCTHTALLNHAHVSRTHNYHHLYFLTAGDFKH